MLPLTKSPYRHIPAGLVIVGLALAAWAATVGVALLCLWAVSR